MNSFKLCFVVLGLMYATIGVLAVAGGLSASIVISVLGMLLCSAGWSISDRYL